MSQLGWGWQGLREAGACPGSAAVPGRFLLTDRATVMDMALAAEHATRSPDADPFRPSEHTAALIQVLREDAGIVRGADVLEIGCGSGVVLAALGGLGAASLCGVEVEPAALTQSSALLAALGFGPIALLHLGDMWQPVGGRRFNLVVANLPHFPATRGGLPGRLASWSDGGANGRRLLDPFLRGLDAHLTPGGRALITHNGFVGLERTRALLAPAGLVLRIRLTALLPLGPDKLAQMSPEILARQAGRSVHLVGPHGFAETHVAEIRSVVEV